MKSIGQGHLNSFLCTFSVNKKRERLTLRPLALLIALRGLNTLSTLRIFTTLMALDL